jgi:hypothetical protein
MTDRDKRARALFDKCVSKLETENETIDEWATNYADTMKTRIAKFRMFVVERGLPEKADMMTWLALFREEWEAANGDILSRAQIEEFAGER